MITNKKLIILSVMLGVFLSAGAQEGEFKRFEYKEFENFVPAPIPSTGVPVCDRYFSQLEACMKKMLPPESYTDLEIGLREAKQAVIFDSGNDLEGVQSRCQQAMDAAKAAYSSQGCAFQ